MSFQDGGVLPERKLKEIVDTILDAGIEKEHIDGYIKLSALGITATGYNQETALIKLLKRYLKVYY